MITEIVSAQVGGKWIAFKSGADMSEFIEGSLKTWSIEHKECDTETMIQTDEKIGVPAESRTYPLSYNLAFAEVHIEKVHGPKSSEAADREFLKTLPPPILSAFVGRVDNSRGFTQEEYDSLKKPKPSASSDGGSGDSASS